MHDSSAAALRQQGGVEPGLVGARVEPCSQDNRVEGASCPCAVGSSIERSGGGVVLKTRLCGHHLALPRVCTYESPSLASKSVAYPAVLVRCGARQEGVASSTTHDFQERTALLSRPNSALEHSNPAETPPRYSDES